MDQSSKPAILAFDTETTGLVEGVNEIISLSAILYDTKLNELDKFTVYAFPDRPEYFDDKARTINGYTEELWKERGAISQELLAKGLLKWFSKRNCYRLIPLGQNVKFDVGHVRALFESFGFEKEFRNVFKYHVLDTVSIAMFFDMVMHKEINQEYNLGTLCERFEIPLDNAHDAEADVRATVALFKRLCQLVKADGDDELTIKLASTAPSKHLSSKLIGLSTDTGAWVFKRGKHQGSTLIEVAENAPGYLDWMLNKVDELSPEQRDAITQALNAV